MKHLRIFFLATLCLLIPCRAQERLPSAGIIPVMSWGGVAPADASVENYRKLKDVGVTVDIAFSRDLPSLARALDAAGKAGLKLLVSCPELKSEPEKTASLFRSHPALEGYYLADEPSEPQFQELGERARKLKAADPDHYSFVNLYPNINSNQSKFGTRDYKEYVDRFDQLFPAPYLSFDFYPVVDGGIHPRWYENMEFFAAKYRTEGRPFWAFALTTSYLAYSDDSPRPGLNDFLQLYSAYRPEKVFVHDIPTLAELRLQVYVNLAYGAQGIEYWSFRGFGAPLDFQGRRTAVYDRVQTVSREMQNLSGVFLGARPVSVVHTGLDIPDKTSRPGPWPAPISLLETLGTGAVVSLLENRGSSFLVVVNRDFQKPMKLILKTDDTVKRVLKDGSLVPAREYASALEVDAGDAMIFTFPVRPSVRP